MPTSTYTALATTTTSGGETSVTFSSIPATYRDLVLVVQPIDTTTNGGRMRFNSDSGSNYSYVYMGGTGSAAESYSGTTNGVASWVAQSTISTVIFQIMDYSATDKHKTVLDRSSRSDARVRAAATRWANTSAITSIELNLQGADFSAGSTFSLYGIAS